jgi:hypothetical protein
MIKCANFNYQPRDETVGALPAEANELPVETNELPTETNEQQFIIMYQLYECLGLRIT